MKKNFITFIIFFVCAVNLFSQHMTISQINASNFPIITTDFMISDSSGEVLNEINTNNFEVYENNQLIPKNTYQISCYSAPYKIILVLDQSTSMNEIIDGNRRWDWVIQSATNFINSLNLSNGSEVALETFGGESYWKCGFTNNKSEIIDSMLKITPYGKTNFNVPMFGPSASAIDTLSTQPFGFRRIVVFLTDGSHSDQNDPIVHTDSILSQCLNNNIQFFAITFQAQSNSELSTIAQSTNGSDYVIVSPDGLTKIYSLISNKILNDQLCSISWMSDVICDGVDRLKNVKLVYKPYKKIFNLSYIVPEYGVSKIQSDSLFYKFGDPDVGSYSDVEVVLTPKNSPTSISSITIIPSTYFTIIDYGKGVGISPNFPITIPQDSSLRIKVRFTQLGIKTLRFANLQISANPCPAFITLMGGLPEIIVDNPIKDQVFSSCDTVVINWSGVDSGTSVDLSYYDEGQNNWQNIGKNLTGNSYKWYPPAISEGLRVKAEISPAPTYIWAVSGGGKLLDNAKSIAISPDNMYIYVAGFFNNIANISGKYLISKGGVDAFIAKYDIDSNIQWVRNDGGTLNDSAFSVATDAAGNVYYVGTCYSDATFGGMHSVMPVFTNEYLYVVKYSPDGDVLNVFTFGASDSYPNFRAYGRSIAIAGNTVTVVGQYTGTLKVGNFTFPNSTNLRNFTISLDQDLGVRFYSLNGVVTTRTSVMDKKGYKYEIQNFKDFKNFGRFTTISQGDMDFSVSKFGPGSESFDISDTFNVYAPNYIFTQSNFDLGRCYLGDTCQTTFVASLKNNTKVPATISGFNIISVPPGDTSFVVDSVIVGKTLQPDSLIDIPINFSTIKLGNNFAKLQLFGNCGEYAEIDLIGIGVCETEVVDTVYFDQVFVGAQDTIQVDSLIQNLTNVELIIDPILQGQNATDFQLIKISSDTISKKSNYSVKLIFNPLIKGKRVARINLRMQTLCGEKTIILIGEGIDYQPLPPDEIDWKVRRINKSYDTTIKIYNPTTKNYNLTGIKFESSITNSEFTYPSGISLPLILPAKDTTYFPISFFPTDEIQYTNAIILTVGNSEGSNDIRVDLQGHGFYPQYEYEWSCGPIVKPLEKTISSLKIRNTQQYSNLTIQKIFITSPDNVYLWSSGSEPQNILVLPQNEISFPVDFTPISSQPALGTVVIFADDYDGNFTDFWRETRFNIACTAIDLENPPTIDFGNLLVCSSTIAQFLINNISPDTSLELYLSQALISGPDGNDFKLVNDSNIFIDKSDSMFINLMFTPSHFGKHSANISIPNSFNIPINIQLVGYGEEITLVGVEKNYNMLPGETKDFSIIASIPKINQTIDSIKLHLSYNHSAIQLNLSDELIDIQPWVWDTSKTFLNDEYLGKGIINTPFNGTIAKFKILGLLNINKSTQIKATIDYGCSNREFLLSEVNLFNVCMDSLIQIQLVNDLTFIEPPVPNPAEDVFTLKFGVGENSDVNISIYDILGNKVLELINKPIEKGVYNNSFDTSLLQPGMYSIIYNCKSYKFVEPLVIIR